MREKLNKLNLTIPLNKKIEVEDIGNTIKLYNGQKKVNLHINEGMLFHYVGEFVATKKQGGLIHKMKKKKKKT